MRKCFEYIFTGGPMLLIVLMILTISQGISQAQTPTRDFDFQHYPALNYDIQRLQLDLNIDPQPLHLDGIAQYTISPRVDSLQTIRMHAIRLDIQQVQVNDQQTDFAVNGDTLQITLPEPVGRGKKMPVSIRYRATPDFGVLRDTSGTVWTSRLPRSNAHWLPVLAHPRVEFKTNLHYTAPPKYTVVSNGSFVEENVVSVDKKQFHFQSDKPIAASELSFVAGPLVQQKVSFGVKIIRGYFLPGTITEQRQKALVDTAYRALNRSEEILQHEYPYSAFNFVVLPDHHWETKNYASSMGILYQNSGELSAQLKRTVYAQWFGSYQREEQWMDAEGILLYQAWLANRSGAGPMGSFKRSEVPDSVGYQFYDVFAADHWLRWHNFFRQSTRKPMKRVIDRTTREVIGRGDGVYNWDDYARLWYDYSGQPWFSIPELPRKQQPDTSRYRVKTYYDLTKGLLAFRFTAEQHPIDELVTLPLTQVRTDTILHQKLTFTGKRDSVVFNTPAGLQNVYIGKHPDIPLKLDIQKPKVFWIHQLRNAESPSARAEGARGLKNYSKEPDLQLLLNQVLKNDSAVRVRAAVYSTLATILQGATGTQDTFLKALRTDHFPIQREALQALTYYKDEPRVKNAARRFALDQSHPPLVKRAARVYAEMAGEEEFISFAGEFVQRDSLTAGLSFVLDRWIRLAESREPLQVALNYTADDYTFKTRSQMITLLTKHGEQFQSWLDKIPELLQDMDPRIRYITVESLHLLSEQRAREEAEAQRAVEYDARVVGKLNSFIH